MRPARVDIGLRIMYSEQVALERSTAWFVMVCACSLRTQQCAVFVSAMFVCVVCASDQM
jgi:hypothetical protein